MPDDAGDVDEPAAIVSQQSIRHIAKRRKQIEIAVAVVVDPRRLPRHAVQVDANRRFATSTNLVPFASLR